MSLTAADFGRTSGKFEVTSLGAAGYSIPIWTPPGPNGLTPNIALSYDSQSGNGVGGVGWHLSAGGLITRCDRSKHQDGSTGAVEITSADRYCINGNRLRLASGTYGGANSVYFTEIADYSRITAYGTTGSGPTYFIVEGKNGLHYEYGNSALARVELGGSVLTWHLNKVSDRSGNTYSIFYTSLNGTNVPSRISWTPEYNGATSYRYRAEFVYTDSRADVDSWVRLIGGYPVIDRYRLAAIRIKSNANVVRKYRFTYSTSSATDRSLLSTVTECADEAESNCLLPLTFSYQTGVVGVTPGSGSVPAGSSNNIKAGRYDFNGDGKHDILYFNGTSWQVAFGASSGFSAPYPAAGGFVDRFLPNGRDAIANISGGVLWIYRWDDSSSSFVGQNTGLSNVSITTTADFNGDGLADLVHVGSMATSVSVRRNISSGSGNPTFEATTSASAWLPSGHFYPTGVIGYVGKGVQRLDVNGDGRQDLTTIILKPLYVNGQQQGFTSNRAVLLGSDTGFSVPPSATWELSGDVNAPSLHFNGDKCTDRIYGNKVYVAQCNGAASSVVTVPAAAIQLLDWDGDGKTDVLVNNGGNFGVYRSTGTGFGALQSTSISATGTYFALDQDGDGLEDLIKVNGSSAINYWTHTPSGSATAFATNIPDLLSSVVDGFGVSASASYTSTGWSNYDKGSTTNYPLQELGPRIVVAKVSTTNGIGGTFDTNYFYVGARKDALRREGVGFQRVDKTDSRNGIIERVYFDQEFPVAGMLSQQELIQPNGVTPIARTVYDNGFATLETSANNQRYFPHSLGSSSTQYEVGGTWNAALLRTVVSTNMFDAASGSLYDQTTTTTEPVSMANGVHAGASWTERTLLTNLLNDSANWCLGRPGKSQQINSHTLTYGASITRTTDVTWDASKCRPTQTVDESGNGALQVTTGLGYDSFGNVTSTTVTGVGVAARTTSVSYSDATFTTGQFPLSVTNALNQTTHTAWNYDLGVPTSTTDPNELSTSWLYDAFGRRTRENHADGTASTWVIGPCSAVTGTCTVGTGITQTLLNSANQLVATNYIVLDVLDRAVMAANQAPADHIRIDREYDALGRVQRETGPFFWSSWARYWTTFSYDLADRPTQVARPISDSNPTLQYSYAYYEGLTTRAVDAQSKQSVKVLDAAGQLARSTDHDGYFQSFDYDAFGLLKRAQDSAGNTLQSSTYNIRGMLTSRTDMDMGSWGFTPNALGEVVSQTDAKSQTTSFAFDLLGRLSSRTEAEGTSTWTWGTSAHNTASNKYIGGLKSISGPGYSETYTNDALGRPSSTSILADTTYQIDYTYNNIGALDTLTYPTSTSSYRLKLQYDYQYGQLYRVRDFNALTTHFWTGNAANAWNQVTQESLGNGLVTNRSYDAVTGFLKSVQTGLSGGSGVQNLKYEWDLVGNLKQRKDDNQSGLTETFYYDNLHRLDYSLLTGVPGNNLDLAYDAMGNITNKSDVGTYTYHATKKHQVSATSNGWSFGYDNNGNMTSGRGRSIDWTSYNYPSCIRAGAACTGTSTDYSAFSYTPDRRYWRQISNYMSGGSATTIYVGGILEKVSTSGGTDFRHMIRAGGSTIIVSRQSTGTNSIHYVTSDHLGSSSAVTNASGGILVNSSFDAFGKRRGSNWSGSPSSGDWAAIASTTRRGYTDHTMLDNLGLIHMNGRVQDPTLGKFISADPNIPHPTLTQSYNRYSYVRNNPLSLVDPSGFDDEFLPKREDNDDSEGRTEVRRTSGSNLWDFATNYGNSAWVTCSGNCIPSHVAHSSDGVTRVYPIMLVRPQTEMVDWGGSNGHLKTFADHYEIFLGALDTRLLYASYSPSHNNIMYSGLGPRLPHLESLLATNFSSFGFRVAGAWNGGLSTFREAAIWWGAGEIIGPYIAASKAVQYIGAQIGKLVNAARELSFGRKLDFLFNKGIDQSNAYNAARAAANHSRIGIADTAANRAEVTRLFNQAYRDPNSIVGPGTVPGSNLREFFLPGVTGTGSKVQFVELNGQVITIIAK
jgi:RHS repeat-associated protein